MNIIASQNKSWKSEPLGIWNRLEIYKSYTDNSKQSAWQDEDMASVIALKYITEIPSAFTASFYSGLRPMLLLSLLEI